MRLTKTFSVLFALGLNAVILPLNAAADPDPGVPDTVRVDSVTAFVSGIGVVPVTFYNDEELAYIEVTLRQYSDQIRIDSFSFAGGRLEAAEYSREVLINSDSSIVAVAALALTTPISPGSGLLGKLYLSYSQTITPQSVLIDSVLWFAGPRQHSTSLRTYTGGLIFKPQFIPGQLKIIETPATFDSVWVANVEAAPGTPVAVDVYGFNERDLAQIALALDYGSNDLIFDSVSFLGTRSATAPSKTVQPFVDVHKLYTLIEFAVGVPLPPGSGPIATLHFTVVPGAPNEVILVDSTTVGIVSNTRFTLTPEDGSISFTPLFHRGSLTIKTTTDVDNNGGEATLPTEYALSQNYPNPFNPSTIIEFSLPQGGRVEVEVFNILGRRMRTLLNRELSAGVHQVVFDGRSDAGASLATGVYFYRLTTSGFHDTKKMLLVK